MNSNRTEPRLSRRTFVTVSAIAAVAGGSSGASALPDESDTLDEEGPSRWVLATDDLVDGDAYVGWRVDPTAAPLPSHIETAVDEFTPGAGKAVGFVATAAVEGPDSIESAVYRDVGDESAVSDAVAEWVEREHSGVTTRTSLRGGHVQWVSASSTAVEALRLDRLPGNHFAVTTACGDGESALDPQTAVEYYAGVVSRRAGSRLQAGEKI